MKKIDVLGFYEHKARELDTLVLLKMYLKKREYEMIIADITFTSRKATLKFIPRIILFPFFHSKFDAIIYPFLEEKTNRCINLHWEQIGSANSQKFFLPKDNFAKNMYHVSWSRDFTSFLINEGKVDPSLILETGNPKADFVSCNFRKYYTPEKILKQTLGIPEDWSFYVFIMSFASGFVSDRYISTIEKKGGFQNFREFAALTKISFQKCINEIKRLAIDVQKEGVFIVLRPHPMTPIKEILKRVKDIKNIIVSREFPLHEVIYHSKGVISWLSTGTIDAYIFNKPTVILRPVKIPEKYEIKLLKGFQFAKNHIEMGTILKAKPNFDNKTLNLFIKRIYGNIDGKNTLRLLRELIKILNSEPSHVEIKKDKILFKEIINYLTKSIPKSFLAKTFPAILPPEIQGRLDDYYNRASEKKLIEKYKELVLTYQNKIPN